MYIQITNRCNMSCEHCCYSCGKYGQDMTIKTFRNCLKKIGDSYISIGGGEPTIHPKFWQIIGESLSMPFCEYVWLATNGSKAETAIALANLAKKGVLGCALSLDAFHDEISDKVKAAFQKDQKVSYNRNENDHREIRNVSGHIIEQGRAAENGMYDEDGCCCPEIFIRPGGDVYGCGCADARCFGNVNKTVKIPDNWEYGECCKNQKT